MKTARMNRTMKVLLTAAAFLAILTGCAMTGNPVKTVSEGEYAALTVRVVNQTGESISYVAASYAAT